MPIALLWFRNDLRLHDNPALRAALDGGYTPLPVYVHAPAEEGHWRPGAASDAWRHRSLAALDGELRKRDSRLRLFTGPSLATLQTLIAATGAQAVFWNRRYEPAIEQRDAGIKQALRGQGIRAESFRGNLIAEPWTIASKQGTAYRVFTPYWRAVLSDWRPIDSWQVPPSLPDDDQGPSGLALDALKLQPHPVWDRAWWDQWQPGEAGAQLALEVLIDGALRDYQRQRDRPDRVGTSRLSPHLHFGEISPWQVVRALEDQRGRASSLDIDIDAAIRQIGWREFAYHLLHHFPQTPDLNFNPGFNDFRWAPVVPEALAAWQQGRTGVPIVDAGMRELWATGWMHNRARLIVGSYLTRHLRYHWRHGAQWFWDTLVDADLANNTMGWQWIGGTGADAAPYYRIFNPVTQAEKFDPDGRY
ncbi:MAG: deoxyribodipyrimidine photo-lyase, partial [Lysobacter sp.]|nr:deoxyribodipyrimidine photo-lyase [Lysobacter sp.]